MRQQVGEILYFPCFSGHFRVLWKRIFYVRDQLGAKNARCSTLLGEVLKIKLVAHCVMEWKVNIRGKGTP
jgi:hypothetical protein